MAGQSTKLTDYPTIETLFRHNVWANTRLFDLCAGLTDEQLDVSIVGTYGSIRDTLEHIASAEYSYWHRITTGKPFRRPADAPRRSVAKLGESIQESGQGLIDAAPKVQAQESVEVNWDGTRRSVPSAILLTQAINHATEHRAQIMATLTQVGIEPPELDGWSYFEARSAEE